MSKLTDEWQTPQWLFDELNREFGFTIDLCANVRNRKCQSYFRDFINWPNRDLVPGNVCYMNPPYSKPKPFIEKAWDLAKTLLVVCLIKCDPSTKCWGIFWDYENHKPKPGCEVRFLPKRIKFIKPGGTEAGAANFPSAIIIMDRRNIQ